MFMRAGRKTAGRLLLALAAAAALGIAVPAKAAQASGPVKDGLYQLISAVDERYVWDISNASAEDGANLQVYINNGSKAQKFYLTHVSQGYYTIININSQKAVDCAGGESYDGVNLQQYEPNQTDAQLWKLSDAGGGYYILACKCNGKVADVAGGVAVDGANMQLYMQNGSDAQKFKLAKVSKEEGVRAALVSNSGVVLALAAYLALIGATGVYYYMQGRRKFPKSPE